VVDKANGGHALHLVKRLTAATAYTLAANGEIFFQVKRTITDKYRQVRMTTENKIKYNKGVDNALDFLCQDLIYISDLAFLFLRQKVFTDNHRQVQTITDDYEK
jgi:hypothetical protein